MSERKGERECGRESVCVTERECEREWYILYRESESERGRVFVERERERESVCVR